MSIAIAFQMDHIHSLWFLFYFLLTLERKLKKAAGFQSQSHFQHEQNSMRKITNFLDTFSIYSKFLLLLLVFFCCIITFLWSWINLMRNSCWNIFSHAMPNQPNHIAEQMIFDAKTFNRSKYFYHFNTSLSTINI